MTTSIADLIDRAEKIREDKDIPKGKFGPEIGVTSSTYQKWTYGRFEPKGKNILKLQEYIEEYESEKKSE